MSNKEGYLHDYLAAAFVGLALALYVNAAAKPLAEAAAWGPFVAVVVVSGLFLFIPAAFAASYLNFRFHQMSDNKKMAGLSAGIFTATVYTIITLISAIVDSIAITNLAGNFFIAWILEVVFAFIFMALGGYVEGSLEESSYQLPSFFNMEKIQRTPSPPPPPPPGNAQNCPTCGRPMRFIDQYQRWYCDYDKKYA